MRSSNLLTRLAWTAFALMWVAFGVMGVSLFLMRNESPFHIMEGGGLPPIPQYALITGLVLAGLQIVLFLGGALSGIVRDSWRGRHMQDPVRGTALVVSATAANPRASSQNYQITCVVNAPGIPATTVEHRGFARTSKWPYPGAALPVTVDRADPSRMRIEWREVSTGYEQGLNTANAMAAQMRGQKTAVASFQAGGIKIMTADGKAVNAGSVPGIQSDLAAILGQSDPAARKRAVQELKAKLDASSAEGTSGRLKELAELHASGAISDTEYLKKRKEIIDAF